MVSTPVKLMPHPSYVYAAQFHTRVARVIVTGSYDRIVRVWSIQGDEVHAEVGTPGQRGWSDNLFINCDELSKISIQTIWKLRTFYSADFIQFLDDKGNFFKFLHFSPIP